MTTVTTRAGKGSALTYAEMDANFNNLNTDKLEAGTSATNIANTPSGNIVATNVQAAINELDSEKEPADATILKSASIGVTLQGYDPNTAKLNVAQVWNNTQKSTIITDNDVSFDLSATGNDYSCTPTGVSVMSFTNIASNAGKSGHIKFINSSNYSIAKGTNIKSSSSFFITISNSGSYLIGYWTDGTDVYLTTSGEMI